MRKILKFVFVLCSLVMCFLIFMSHQVTNKVLKLAVVPFPIGTETFPGLPKTKTTETLVLESSINISESLVQEVKLPKCYLNVSELQEERFKIDTNATVGTLWNPNLRGIKYGGNFCPDDCMPDQNLAVIIPYRDRFKHLEILLNNLHSMLQKQKLRYTIYVVEMALPTRFNRGMLLNIGFKEALVMSNHDCFVFHDVDLVPMNEKNLYRCGDQPVHLSSANSKFDYKLLYSFYIGGVAMLSKSQFEQVNGFSNVYFGWGAEDDDFSKRISAENFSIVRPDPKVGKYYALPHGHDISNPKSSARMKLFSKRQTRFAKDGLNSLKYQVLSIEYRPLYTWIYIKCKELDVFKGT